ncbi:MAG: hypothetical protein PHT54_04460 [Candidatus Nanoarchaeia archaeon]|nr:hypothetical protein [Candidatus Nanoarchaeia archaeon]
MSILDSIDDFKKYMKELESLFFIVGALMVFLAFLFRSEFVNFQQELIYLMITSLILLAIIGMFIIITVWTFINWYKYKGNIIILFSFMFFFILTVLWVGFVYLEYPILIISSLSFLYWIFVSLLLGDFIFYLRFKLIRLNKKWYFHLVLNILIFLFIWKVMGIFQNFPDIENLNDVSDFWYYWMGILALTILVLLFDTVVSLFNKSRGAGILKELTHNFERYDFFLITKIEKGVKWICNEFKKEFNKL